MKLSLALFWLMVLATVAVAVWGYSRHVAGQRRYMTLAVTRQIEAHAPQIARLLSTMRGTDASLVEEAAYQELRTGTSLFERPMVRVTAAADGSLDCVIDTSSLGIAPRTIRASAGAPP